MVRKLKKNEQGFTLVEVIVVAVIVAVLAAVAIPLYLGYVNDATQNVVNNEAANFSSAVAAGVNSSATACVSDGKTPPTYTWTIATTELTAKPPTYKFGTGVTMALVGASTLIASPGTATITYKTKTATASW
jgi:type IV pilus assembly protein PilA